MLWNDPMLKIDWLETKAIAGEHLSLPLTHHAHIWSLKSILHWHLSGTIIVSKGVGARV
jgi:hypothetical protein